MTDATIKHLEFIQNVITRMNTNSFLIKGWMITLVSALFAFAAKDSDPGYSMITFAVIPMFWGLDAFYLSQERQYRAHYDSVRLGQSTDFSMDAARFNLDEKRWCCALFSKTILPLYGFTFTVAVIITLWLGHR